uniref:Aspartoacylase n=1 Tax=Ciona savignyi TaxID=51511 RepID=H2ZAV1_CIOSA
YTKEKTKRKKKAIDRISLPLCNQVVVFGGTHGNELSGIWLVRKWQTGLPLKSETCKVTSHLTNPEAIKLCRRYKDCDINRQFLDEKLTGKPDAKEPYEVQRAREIYSTFSDTSRKRLILDMHNTTANMGLCLIVEKESDLFALHMCRYIQNAFPKDYCRVMLQGQSYGDIRYIVKHGIAIEVGPQPHGVLRSDIADVQEKAVKLSLEFVDLFNKGHQFGSCEISAWTLKGKVDFPRDEKRNIEGMIHRDIQDQDWKPISGTTNIFQALNGQNLTLADVLKNEYDAGSEVYPLFINEASYYEKDLAFWLSTKSVIMLPAL